MNISTSLDNFSGTAPILAQPRWALFPGASQILSLVNPKYRQMVADVLHGDRLIALALGKPGWEAEGDASLLCHDVVCLGQIVSPAGPSEDVERIYLQGLRRARIVQDLTTPLPYRLSRLELLEDRYSSQPTIDRAHRRAELVSLFRQLFPNVNRNEIFHIWSEAKIPLGTLCDVMAEALRMEPWWKQELLDEIDADCRSDQLLEIMRRLLRRQGAMAPLGFPAFSVN